MFCRLNICCCNVTPTTHTKHRKKRRLHASIHPSIPLSISSLPSSPYAPVDQTSKKRSHGPLTDTCSPVGRAPTKKLDATYHAPHGPYAATIENDH
mmetsp:Transcript_26377/g.65572  ORF Transcript_26377/g.65572 Transcript_26377/m.65572 type:complete len:96 (-) Transcript_26377:666-953(-)